MNGTARSAITVLDERGRRNPLLLPIGVLILCTAIDLLNGRDVVVSSPFLILVGPLAALAARPREVLVVGLAATAARAGLGFYDRALWEHTVFFVGLLISFLAVVLFSMYTARLRGAREEALRSIAATAAAVQRAVLTPPEPHVGDLEVAARYVSASRAADIGGDLYEVVATPFGTRVLVGDVQGKGLGAIHVTARVLAAFREAAPYEAELTGVVARVEARTAQTVTAGGFVTGLFAQFNPGGEVELVSCGHEPALVLTPDHGLRVLVAPDPGPPLGLAELSQHAPASWTAPFRPGETMLMYTDGVTEARSPEGRFYPLEKRLRTLAATASWPSATLEERTDAVFDDLLMHAGGQPDDDVVLLMLRRHTEEAP